jgi:hypothetical protein
MARRSNTFSQTRSLVRAASLAGKLWTLPNTLLGLLLGLPFVLSGARIQRRDNALVFLRLPIGRGAIVFGNVILASVDSLDVKARCYSGDAFVRLGDHERAHTYQYEVLGPLFLPMYLLLGWWRGGVISARNPFEAAADRYAQFGRGWWPKLI